MDWAIKGRLLLATIGVALVLPLVGLGQEPAVLPPVSGGSSEDVRLRLEKLEKQNEALTRRLQELLPRGESGEPKDAAKSPSADVGAKAAGADTIKMEPIWKNGLFFQSKDKAFKYSVGGTIQFDMGAFGAPQNVKNSIGTFNNFVDPGQALGDGMDFRRARLRIAGTAYEIVDFFAQYDFANSLDLRRRTIGVTTPTAPTIYDFAPGESTQFNEVYVGLTQIPLLGAVRVGHHREGLNFITSTADRNQVWMERGLMFDAFNGDFNFSSGVTIDRTYLDQRLYSWLGFFENNSRAFSQIGDGNYAYDIRLCALPVWAEDEDELWVHVGVDYSYRNLTQNQIRYRARPMIRIGAGFQVPNIVDTGTFFSNDAQQIVNLEYATAWGPWTFAAEACTSWVTNAYTGGLPGPGGALAKGVVSRGTFVASGAYVEWLRFLTPDHRQYRKDRPGYDRVAPRENYSHTGGDGGCSICGRGAWEVGVRFDVLDLTSAGINGGNAQAITAAVNWYLNPNTRVQWNAFVMHRDFGPSDTSGRVDGSFTGLGFRVNMDF